MIIKYNLSTTTNGQHSKGSNHYTKKARALDISRIDGITMKEMGADDPRIKALQDCLEELPDIRENFGPHFRHRHKRRHSNERLRKTHKDHIHFSVNP